MRLYDCKTCDWVNPANAYGLAEMGAEWAAHVAETHQTEPATYGMCLACRSVEVALVEVIGTRDLSGIGEHPEYPVGYGCEVCS